MKTRVPESEVPSWSVEVPPLGGIINQRTNGLVRGLRLKAGLQPALSLLLLGTTRVGLQAQAAGPEEDIRGPKPKVEIPAPEEFNWMPWIIAACVLVVLVAFGLWWRFRSPRRIEVAAWDRAMKALSEVDRERNALEPGVLADRAAGIVRQFVAERFGIAAPQRTTEEFLRAAEKAPPLEPYRELLHKFLQACDAAKFAGADFDQAERLTLLQHAMQFVRAAPAFHLPVAAGNTNPPATAKA